MSYKKKKKKKKGNEEEEKEEEEEEKEEEKEKGTKGRKEEKKMEKVFIRGRTEVGANGGFKSFAIERRRSSPSPRAPLSLQKTRRKSADRGTTC